MSTQIITALERCRQLASSGVFDEDDIDAASLRAEIDAALAAARKLIGNGRPELKSTHLHFRMTQAIERAGGIRKWAATLGISKSYAHEIYSSKRPAPDHVLAKMGLARSVQERFLEL